MTHNSSRAHLLHTSPPTAHKPTYCARAHLLHTSPPTPHTIPYPIGIATATFDSPHLVHAVMVARAVVRNAKRGESNIGWPVPSAALKAAEVCFPTHTVHPSTLHGGDTVCIGPLAGMDIRLRSAALAFLPAAARALQLMSGVARVLHSVSGTAYCSALTT